MNYKIIYLLLIFSLSACSNFPLLNNSCCQSEYHEDFEEEITFKHPIFLQDIVQMDLSIRFSKDITFSVSYEGTYEGNTSYSNVYANLSTRF